MIYELRTERQISSITEPTGTVLWDQSPYFLLHFTRTAAEDTTLVLTIRYADGRHRPHDDAVPGADRGAGAERGDD